MVSVLNNGTIVDNEKTRENQGRATNCGSFFWNLVLFCVNMFVY